MFYRIFKRILDFLFAVITLIVFFPFFLIIAMIIRIESPGKVIFSQKRIGRNSTTFNIYKFRTMRIDAPHDKATNKLDDAQKWITKFGGFLRKSSLDELPQLVNVIKGNMSLIGPRPALWNQYDLIEERKKYDVHSLRPGLTGYAQIHGRDNISIEEKALLDGFYKNNISFKLDFSIFFKTIFKIFTSENVREGKR